MAVFLFFRPYIAVLLEFTATNSVMQITLQDKTVGKQHCPSCMMHKCTLKKTKKNNNLETPPLGRSVKQNSVFA